MQQWTYATFNTCKYGVIMPADLSPQSSLACSLSYYGRASSLSIHCPCASLVTSAVSVLH